MVHRGLSLHLSAHLRLVSSPLSSKVQAVGSAVSHAANALRAQLRRRTSMRLPVLVAASQEARRAAYALYALTMVSKELSSTARSPGGESPPPASCSHMSWSPLPEGP
jgi:hypothetical protein